MSIDEIIQNETLYPAKLLKEKSYEELLTEVIAFLEDDKKIKSLKEDKSRYINFLTLVSFLYSYSLTKNDEDKSSSPKAVRQIFPKNIRNQILHLAQTPI
jgi:hypothetical protein